MVRRLKRFFNKLKKHWTRVWLIAILAVSGTFIAVAAYTEVSSVKRVVSTIQAPGEPFSSNTMRKGGSSRPLTAFQFPVSVCNFDQNYPMNYSNKALSYTLEATLKVKIDESDYTVTTETLETLKSQNKINQAQYDYYLEKALKYSIQFTENDNAVNQNPSTLYFMKKENNTYANQIVEFSETLPTGKSNADIFTVTIDENDIKDASNIELPGGVEEEPFFFVEIKAVPGSGLGVSELSATLYGLVSKEKKSAWNGSIQEDDWNYDFFNYVITGSGEETIEFSWNPVYLEVNKYFIEMNNLQIEDGSKTGWKKITLPVGANGKSRYEFQLYKVSEGAEAPSNYTDFKIVENG